MSTFSASHMMSNCLERLSLAFGFLVEGMEKSDIFKELIENYFKQQNVSKIL